MDEFDATVQSLLESVVDYVGKDHLQAVAVLPDRPSGSAHIEICLRDESSAAVRHALQRIGEVRRLFIDDVSFDYVLTDEALCDRIREQNRKSALVYA